MSTAAHARGLELDDKPLEMFYMKMIEPNCDARLGKLQPGDIVPMDRAKAQRWLIARVAVQVAQGEYEEQQDRKLTRASAQQAAFQAINDGHAMWDVSTYRDVLTAPEAGLRQAFENGIPLVNVHHLRDENGDPVPPNADIEDILDARELMHPDLVAPLAAHDRSSVMGGGSPYGTPMPLSPQHRAMMQQVANQEAYAQQPANPDSSFVAPDTGSQSRQRTRPSRAGERSKRAVRRAGKVSAEGKKIAAEENLPPPSEVTGEQVAN